MKKLTKEKLLNSTLKELGFNIDGNLIEYDKVGHRPIQIEVGKIGIELIPEQPEVNIKNLGRFMMEYGAYPEAEFGTGLRQDGISPYIGFLKSTYIDPKGIVCLLMGKDRE
jgi:hypothetical protein